MQYIKYPNEIIEITDEQKEKEIGFGMCANIYLIDNIAFKEYLPALSKAQARLDFESYNMLKQINEDCFIELYDIYQKARKKDYQSATTEFKVDAYTAKFYQAEKVENIYDIDEYLVESFKKLKQLALRFNQEAIKMNDVKLQNTILTKDGIVIIDPDAYFREEINPKSVPGHNEMAMDILIEDYYEYIISKLENCSSQKEKLKKIKKITYAGL